MDCFLVDGGTTNTRVWLRREGQLLGPQRLAAGVRDTAITGTNRKLIEQLRAAFDRLAGNGEPPGVAVAAGMITSPLGLLEVPHCPAPAGAAELAARAVDARLPDFPGLRWLFIPGVRSGPQECDAASVAEVDMIRGEETELMGLLAGGAGGPCPKPPLVYIHVGSHTKAIHVNERGQITGGVTTLGGELLDVVRTHTILASAVREAPPGAVALDLVLSGASHTLRHGLARALFLVRLLEQGKRYSPAQLNAFLLGACIEADLAAIVPRASTGRSEARSRGAGEPSPPGQVQRPAPATLSFVVSAPDAALPAWAALLAEHGIAATTVGSAEREACFLAGLERIVSFRE